MSVHARETTKSLTPPHTMPLRKSTWEPNRHLGILSTSLSLKSDIDILSKSRYFNVILIVVKMSKLSFQPTS